MRSQCKMIAPIDLDGYPGAAVRQAMRFENAVGGELEFMELTESSFAVDLPDADLIVATLCEADLSPLAWRASMARRILNASSKPVVVLKVKPDRPRRSFPLRDIMCVVNLDGTDSGVLGAASEFSLRSNARVHLLHVVPEVSEGLLAWTVTPSIRPLSEAAARERLAALPSVYRLTVCSGSLQAHLWRAVRDTGADLVVLPRTTPNLRRLLRRLDCPVLLAPSRYVERAAERDVAVHAELTGVVAPD
jgi:hypothetical protein